MVNWYSSRFSDQSWLTGLRPIVNGYSALIWSNYQATQSSKVQLFWTKRSKSGSNSELEVSHSNICESIPFYIAFLAGIHHAIISRKFHSFYSTQLTFYITIVS